ncbi:MAG TPA: DUF4404 family protein [Myxococcota bacterium]
MPEKRLRETLEELQRKLEEPGAVDAASRELLGELLEDIEAALTREPGEREGEGSSLLDRLSEIAERFEESHPSLTAAVGRVANALSNLGI